jgi:hypothetical protein
MTDLTHFDSIIKLKQLTEMPTDMPKDVKNTTNAEELQDNYKEQSNNYIQDHNQKIIKDDKTAKDPSEASGSSTTAANANPNDTYWTKGKWRDYLLSQPEDQEQQQ